MGAASVFAPLAGTPGTATCVGHSITTLIREFGGLNDAVDVRVAKAIPRSKKSPPSVAPTPVIRFEMARAHRELARDEAREDERRSASE
jgi:hypothetical protein